MTTAKDSGRPGRHVRPGVEALQEQGCGRPLGRFTILRRVAQGGMAEVYLARAPDTSGFARPVAIKKILPQFSNNERFTEMLKDEAKIAVSLTHTNIAQVYELGLSGEDYFIVMEYVEGRPLSKLMRRANEEGMTAVPIAHAVHIMGEVAKGLDHAHRQTDSQGVRRNIVHRDITPQNVLISYAGDVKLIDFGIAQGGGRVNQTDDGVIKGKLRYLAPEIALGEEPDHRADIFCFGIVLFEMLTGEAMFTPQSDAEAIETAIQAKVKSPRARNPKIPRALDEIVMRALRRDRTERYASAHDLYIDLTRFLRSYAPGHGRGELASLMQSMFRSEIVLERSLNEAATTLVGAQGGPAARGATVTESAAEPAYQQLVTRFEIVPDEVTEPGQRVAASNRAKGWAGTPVVSDGSNTSRVPRSATASPKANLRPDPAVASGAANPPNDSAQDQARAAPRRGPMVATDPATGRPSTSGIAVHRDQDSMASAARSNPPALLPWTAAGLEAMKPAELVGMMGTAARAGRDRLFTGAAAILGALLIGLVGWLVFRSPDAPTATGPATHFGPSALAGAASSVDPSGAAVGPLPSASERSASASRVGEGQADPAPVANPVLTLVSLPRVPLTVWLNDEVFARGVRSPVVVAALAADTRYRLRMTADGFREVAIVRSLKPQERRTIEVTLTPATGLIRLVNVQGPVHASAGRVEGDRIVDIPMNTLVSLWIERPGAPAFRKQVEITSVEEVRIEVPRPRLRGTLNVRSEPPCLVYVDGKRRGRTPLSLRVPAGDHSIVLESLAGQTLEVTRTVAAGRTTTFMYRWPR